MPASNMRRKEAKQAHYFLSGTKSVKMRQRWRILTGQLDREKEGTTDAKKKDRMVNLKLTILTWRRA